MISCAKSLLVLVAGPALLGAVLLAVLPRQAPVPAPRPARSNSSRVAAGPAPRGAPAMPNVTYRPPLVVVPKAKHSATVIMLHGLGDQGDGWAAIGAQFAPALPHVKWVFPHAPSRSITLNMGMRMPGWYDITSLEDVDQKEDAAGLHESKRYVESLVEAEVASGLTSDRVVVAGFSQGGAVALLTLRSQLKLAGVIGLSTYMPLRNEPPLLSPANSATPILQCHGDSDQVIRLAFGASTHKLLEGAGAKVTWKVYRGMAHSASPQELDDVQSFISRLLPPV